jgi:hypothetical protein
MTLIEFLFFTLVALLLHTTKRPDNMDPPNPFKPRSIYRPVDLFHTAPTSFPSCKCGSGLPSSPEKPPENKQREKMWESQLTYLVCFLVILCFPDEKIELGLGVVVIGLMLNFIWALIQLDQSRPRDSSASHEKEKLVGSEEVNKLYT